MTTGIEIQDYLKIVCKMIIDDLNERYNYIDKKEDLRNIANKDFTKGDIVNKFVSIIKPEAKHRSGHIHSTEKNFNIYIHYLKGYKGESGNAANSRIWKEQQSQFNNIEDNIRSGNKGRNIYIIGWFNCLDSVCRVMQVGCKPGGNPEVNEEKMVYFPFIKRTSTPTRVSDIKHSYLLAYRELNIQLIDNKDEIEFNCMFLGEPEDKFHFAIYY